MNSLLKMNGKAWRLVGLVLVMASAGAMFSISVEAGEKKATLSSGDGFQLTLSSKIYTGDPQSKFVHQSCEPGQRAKKSTRKSETPSKKALVK